MTRAPSAPTLVLMNWTNIPVPRSGTEPCGHLARMQPSWLVSTLVRDSGCEFMRHLRRREPEKSPRRPRAGVSPRHVGRTRDTRTQPGQLSDGHDEPRRNHLWARRRLGAVL